MPRLSLHATVLIVAAAGTTAALSGPSPLTAHASGPYGGSAQNGFTSPMAIPGSGGLGEPTIVHDDGVGNSNGVARLFVTAPQSLGTINSRGGSPLYTSTNGGAGWTGPARSQLCTALSGGDTDLGVDGGDNVYQTDLWVGNSCLSVSENHGQSFAAGNPFGSELQPGDDRPWISYERLENQLYIAYDGVDALHVSNTGPLTNPLLGIQATGDNVVVPESGISATGVPSVVRECVCPPGGIASDNSAGPHAGRVYVSYSYQQGTAISYSDPTCTPAGCTAARWTGPIVIPHSGSSGSAFEDEWNFDPIAVDSTGTLYVMWGRALGFNTNTDVASTGVAIQYAASSDGGTTWTGPFTVSTTTSTNTFPAMDVAGPGLLQFAYLGAPGASGDPNKTARTQSWNVYYGTVSTAGAATPVISAPVVAVKGIHIGCIQTGGGKSCSDRSLLDFFSITPDLSGVPNIAYTGGDAGNGVQLYFSKR